MSAEPAWLSIVVLVGFTVAVVFEEIGWVWDAFLLVGVMICFCLIMVAEAIVDLTDVLKKGGGD